MNRHVSQGHPAGQRCSRDLHAGSPTMRARTTPDAYYRHVLGLSTKWPKPRLYHTYPTCPPSLFSAKLKRTVQDPPAPGLCLGCSLRLGGSLGPVSLTR